MLWLPNDNTSMRLIADYSKRDEYCCVGVQLRTGPTYPFIDGLSNGTGQAPPAAGFGALPFSRTAYANRSTGQEVEDKGVSLEINVDMAGFGGATLTSVTSARDWSSSLGQDIDYTGADIVYRVNDGEYGYKVKNLTQEFRLAGATDRVDWLVGLFATKEDIDRNDSWYYGADYTPYMSFLLSAGLAAGGAPFPISLDGQQRNINGNGNTCSATQANAAAIAGVLGASGASTIIGTVCLPWANSAFNNRNISESFDDSELSGTIKASYRLSDEVMVYGSYARGYKSFGYNLDRVQSGITPSASLLFPSEVVDSYEAGIKTTLFNRSVLLNATYFDQTFTDFQLNTFLGTAFVVESIPELTSRGVDADFLWFTPIEGLSFQGGVTYTDAQYGNFTAADLTSPGNFPQLSLLPGARASEDEHWTFEIWGQNLTDEEYIQVAYNAPLQGSAFQKTVQPNGTYFNPALDTQTYDAFLGQPRTFGATLRFKY